MKDAWHYFDINSFCFISNGPTSLFILCVAYKPLLIKQNDNKD